MRSAHLWPDEGEWSSHLDSLFPDPDAWKYGTQSRLVWRNEGIYESVQCCAKATAIRGATRPSGGALSTRMHPGR